MALTSALRTKISTSPVGAALRPLADRAEGLRWQSRGLTFGSQIKPKNLPSTTATPGELESYFDAHDEGPGIWKWRHYFPAYERHLSPFKGRQVRVLEIGIFSGGSLGMWREFLGDGASIVGVDIAESCRAYAGPGIEVEIGDQADPAFWARFLATQEPFDIVIDDGGHETYQQVATLEAVLPAMAPGGVFICEDIHGEQNGFAHYTAGLMRNLHAHHADRPNLTNANRGLEADPTPFQQAVESVHLYPYMTVIERRRDRLEQLVAPKHGTVWEPFLTGGPLPT